MSPRVTRAAARQAASQVASSSPSTAAAAAPATSSSPAAGTATSTPVPKPTRKRKNPTEPSPPQPPPGPSPTSSRRPKRQKVAQPPPPPPPPISQPLPPPPSARHRKGKAPAIMSSSGYASTRLHLPTVLCLLANPGVGHRRDLPTPLRTSLRHRRVGGRVVRRRTCKMHKVSCPPRLVSLSRGLTEAS